MSQALRPVPKVGQTYLMVNDLYTFRATSAETNGGYMLIDAMIPPGGGPPPHIHTRETEIFVVIEGRITCTENGASRTLGPGETITLLPGRTHTFRNDTDKPARMLVVCLPAAIESMFVECGEPVAASHAPGPARPPTREEIGRLVDSCARAGITFA